jgi:hypothetical protein
MKSVHTAAHAAERLLACRQLEPPSSRRRFGDSRENDGDFKMQKLLWKVAVFWLITGACTSYLALPYLAGG